MGIKDIFHPLPGGQPDETKPTAEEQELMERVARKVVKWNMTVPAIIFLESVKPLNYLGSQVMVFFEPFVSAIFDLKDYSTFQRMMEKRHNVENLLLTIERIDAEARQMERNLKEKNRLERPAVRSRFWQRIIFWKK